VGGLKKDVAGLKNNTHSALAQSSLELITSIEHGLAMQRGDNFSAVLRTVIEFVWEAAPARWAFFHWKARTRLGTSD
jgi:hypothetical protein